LYFNPACQNWQAQKNYAGLLFYLWITFPVSPAITMAGLLAPCTARGSFFACRFTAGFV